MTVHDISLGAGGRRRFYPCPVDRLLKPDLNYTVYFILFALFSVTCQVPLFAGWSTRGFVIANVRRILPKNRSPKRPPNRLGRPPKDLAGDVEERILDAAQRVFLKRGFQSASIDEIAELAPASKPTIYAHFAGKEALFAAVVARVMNGLANFDGYEAKGRTLQDKLIRLGTEIAEKTIEDLVGVTRAIIAEADRLPELSRQLHDASRDRAANAVSQVFNDAAHMLPDAPKGPFSTKRSAATAQIFMDLILLPMLMRSLMGHDTKALRKELPSFIPERVSFFLAACEADRGR